MAELNVPIYNFRSGILTRKLRDRPDMDIYKSGAILSENFLTSLHGPKEFRGGFIYSKQSRGNNVPFFLQFTFDDEESYVLSFTEGYLRFFTDQGALTEDAQTPTGITQADPGVITITGHGLSDGDEVYIDNIGGMEELNGKFYLVVYINANTFSLTDVDGDDIDTTAYTAFTSGGEISRVYEIESVYQEDHLPQLKYAQKADLMYIDHPLYLPRKLVRSGSTSWSLSTYTRTDDPYEQLAITGITQANPAQVTVTAHGLSTGDRVLLGDVSGMTDINNEGSYYTVTRVDADNFTLDGVDSTGFDAYTSGGYIMVYGDAPATCGFYGGRLFHGGGYNDPDVINGSMSPDPSTGATRYDTFTLGSSEDDAVSYALTSASATTVDRIRFFAGTRQFLAVGTYSGMLKVNGGSDATPISGTAINSFPIDNYGVADIMPISFGTDLLYVQRGREVVYSFKYSFLNEGYESSDETIQADELLVGGVKQITYQQGNPNRMWAAMQDGRLLTLTYNRNEGASAWDEHFLGGSGAVLTVASEPKDDNVDQVWVAVERTIDGVTRRYIEYLNKNDRIPEFDDFYSGTGTANKEADYSEYLNRMVYAQKRQVHLDSALILDTTQEITITPSAITGSDITFTAGASIFTSSDVGRRIWVKYLTGFESGIARITEYVSATEVKCLVEQDFTSTDAIASGGWYFTQNSASGLEHLEGETVGILANGGVGTEKVVTNGSVTFDGQTTYAIIGLKYLGRIKTMPLELILSTGVTAGKIKTVNKVNFMFRNTLGVAFGYDPYNLQRVTFRTGAQYTDRPAFLFNGVKELPGFDIWDDQRQIYILQTVPYPCTINSLVFDTDVDFGE